MLARRSALIIASLLLGACSSGAADQQQGNPRAVPIAIDGQNRAWMRAVKRGDAAAVAAIYADSSTLYAPESDVVVSRGGVQRFFQSAFEAGLKEMRLTTVNIVAGAQMAREIGRYTATVQPAGAKAPFQEKGKYLVVWMKQPDGSWKIESDSWNVGGAGAAPAPASSADSAAAAK